MEAAAVSAMVSMTLKVVANRLAPLLVKEYSKIVGVKTDLHELRDQVEEINSWLETRHEAMWNDPSFNWLKRLKDVTYDVDDAVDEFQLKAEKHEAAAGSDLMSRYMFTKPKSFILECKVANKIKRIRKRFAAIVKRRADFIAIANSLPFSNPVHRMDKTTFEMQSLPIVDVTSVLGRDQDKDLIITELVKSNVRPEIEIVSITGLGGSGKSTLAKLIFSDGETIKKYFELTLWVHVSQEFNIIKLVEKMFEAIAEEKSDKYPLQYISAEVSKRLNGKKFLLVLDDVWIDDRIQWEQFMVHLKNGAPESKILLTTRNRKVAEAMESIYIFDLPLLSLDDSWQLFYRSFGAGVKGLSTELQEAGKEIVEKCGGVPLAIKSLASVLRGKERIEEWQAIRDNNLLDVKGEEHRVASCLRLSYFHLPSDLKQCFTICSVFPKGHKIDKEQLIDLWIAHDMISVEDGIDYLDYIGCKYFNSLVLMSFLQNVEQKHGRVTCRMHDLVHDLAELILGEEISLVVPKEEENLMKNYRYFSLRELPDDLAPTNTFLKARAIYATRCYDHIFGMALKNATHLRSVTVGSPYVTALPNTIFAITNLKYIAMSRLNCEAFPDAISDVWSLQALHITDSLYLLRLPESIGQLKKLRTLNLSGCEYLERLPDSIGDCHMISNIDLCNCKDLTVLPNSIGNNKELRVLRLGCTRFRRLPSISSLENLECLDLRMCPELVELPVGIWNLKKLEVLNLEGCANFGSQLVLKGQLGQVHNLNIFVVRRGEKIARMSALTNTITRDEDDADTDLSFGHTYVMEPDDAHRICLKQNTNIQSLRLWWKVHDVGEVKNELVQAVLDALEPPPGIRELEIHGHSGWQCARWMQNQVGDRVQGLSHFPFLKVVKLHYLTSMKHLNGLMGLPCLEELKLEHMPSLESISGGPFPSLMKLRMENLPRLGEVWMVADGTMIDELQVGNRISHFYISDCPKLEVKRYLPSSLQHLVLHGSSEQLLLPESLRSLTSLQSLDVQRCPTIRMLPECLGDFTSLRELTIKECKSLGCLPQSIGHLISLQELKIESCPGIKSMPEGIKDLTDLQELWIRGCPELERRCKPSSLQRCKPSSLQHLVLHGSSEQLLLPESCLTSLQSLDVQRCPTIRMLPECLGDFTSLRELTIKECKSLGCLPQSIGHLISLQELKIESCPGIKSMPEGIKDLTDLQELWIRGCPELERRCKIGKGEDWHLICHIRYIASCIEASVLLRGKRLTNTDPTTFLRVKVEVPKAPPCLCFEGQGLRFGDPR